MSGADEGRSGSAERRLVGVDTARGLALLGMMAVHVLPGRGPGGTPTLASAVAGGRSAALFAVLAGVSLALVSGGDRPVVGRRRLSVSAGLVTRAVLIAALGLWLADRRSGVAVILAYYGVLFVVALPFLGLRTRSLVPITTSWLVLAPVVSHLWRQRLPGGPGQQVTWAGLLDDPESAASRLLVTGYYPVLTWTGYLLAGLAVGRLGRAALGSRRVAARLLVGGSLGALTVLLAGRVLAQWAGLPAEQRFFGTTPTDRWAWLLTPAEHSGTPLDFLHTTASALAVLGGCLLLAEGARRGVRRVVAPFAAAGSMTLTLYTGHVLALAAELGPPRGTGRLWAVHAVLALGLALAWRVAWGRGPLERVVRAVSRAVARLVAGRLPEGYPGVTADEPAGRSRRAGETLLAEERPGSTGHGGG